MKTEELTALGLNEDQVKGVFALNGKDIEAEKAKGKKALETAEADRDNYKAQLATATETLKGFEGIDPAKIQQEVSDWKAKAEQAEKDFAAKLTQRDQSDWLKAKMDEYGVTSPYARKQLITEIMDAENGLKWKDGAYMGLDDYMKEAKKKDNGLYQTEEEKAAAKKAEEEKAKAARFAGKTGGEPGDGGKKYTPPKIF